MAGENINRRINIYINDKGITNSSRGIGREMRKVKNEISNLDKSAADYSVRLGKLRDTYKMLSAAQNDFKKDMAEVPGLLGRVKNALGPVATGMLTAFSVQGLVNGFVDKIREGWQTIVEFNQKQADLAAIMGKSRSGINKLTMDAIKYGATTSYNATQVTDLQTELAKLGKTEKEIRGMTKAVLEGATALEAGLGPAAEFIGGQLNSYNETAEKSQKYTDILSNSVNISATSFEYLAGSLPKTSKVAYLANVPFEKLTATMGVLADQNIAAETAGTGFRNILLLSAKAGIPYEKMLQKVNNATDKVKKATELFGAENATVAVILATSTDKINANTKALENSAGSAAKLAKEKLDSIQGDISNFSGAWEGFILNLEKGDGMLAKVARGVITLGTGLLGLITPTRQLSDELREEQVQLNVLVGKMTSSNTTNEERKKLMIELKSEYPDLIKLIGKEDASNEELTQGLIKINEQYRQRILLQKQVERRDEAKNAFEGTAGSFDKYKLEFAETMAEIAQENEIDFTVNYGNIIQSARDLKSKLKSLDMGGGLFGDISKINNFLETAKTLQKIENSTSTEYQNQEKALAKVKKATGLRTEDELATEASLKEQKLAMEGIRKEAESLGMANVSKASDDEVKRWLAAYKEKLRYAGDSDEEKKAREKAANARTKELEKRKKETDDLAKELLASERLATAGRLDILADGYAKERDMANEEFDRKIQDLENKKTKEAEINQLKSKIAITEKGGSKQDKEDLTYFKKELAEKLEINKNYSSAIVSLEEARGLKIGTIREKYLKKEFERDQAAQASKKASLKTEQNNELAQFTNLANAKEVLSNYLNKDELSKVTTLEQAKIAIKRVHLNQDYDLEEKHLTSLMKMWQAAIDQQLAGGIQIFTPEQMVSVKKFLDEAALKVSEIRSGKTDDQVAAGEEEKKNSVGNGLDILGTTPDKWQEIFNNLSTLEGKLKAIGAVNEGMQQVFGAFFDFLDARDARSLQKYERNSNRRKRELADQLEKGYISQEVYNARTEKVELDLARKRGEIEYKEAKRRKAVAIMGAVVSTAQGIAAALTLPPPASYVFAGITGAMGALQVATIASTPLPAKEGFKKGGYTGDGNANEIAGPVHKGEYVIPKDVLFDKDPAMPQIMGYIEAKRKRKRGFKEGGPTEDIPDMPSSGSAPAQSNNDVLRPLMERAVNVLEKLESNGIEGYVVVDVKAAKKIKEKLKELATLQDQAKI